MPPAPPPFLLRSGGLVGLAFVLLALPGCAKEEARRGGRVPILVATVESRRVPNEIEATGTVEASQSAALTARVGGAISRIAFVEGQDVRAGQVLFQIDPRPFDAAVERAAGVLARDRAQVAVAKLELDRAEALVERGVISKAELDTKRSAYEALAATARADAALLSAARLDRSYATVRSPISGRAGDFALDVGEMVRVGDATPLVTVHRVSPIHVRFTVPQDQLPALRRRDGTRMEVDVLPASSTDSTWQTGKLVFVDNAVDAATGTLLLKAEFDNPGGALWPGEFVRVRLRLDEEDGAVVVPAVAVTQAQQGSFAYVVKADTTVEARPIQVARTWRDLAVISNGVAVGEVVVTDGQLRLSDGARAAIRAPGAGGGAGAGARKGTP
jgi:multidrug efflux system membrane fusion protein